MCQGLHYSCLVRIILNNGSRQAPVSNLQSFFFLICVIWGYQTKETDRWWVIVVKSWPCRRWDHFITAAIIALTSFSKDGECDLLPDNILDIKAIGWTAQFSVADMTISATSHSTMGWHDRCCLKKALPWCFLIFLIRFKFIRTHRKWSFEERTRPIWKLWNPINILCNHAKYTLQGRTSSLSISEVVPKEVSGSRGCDRLWSFEGQFHFLCSS